MPANVSMRVWIVKNWNWWQMTEGYRILSVKSLIAVSNRVGNVGGVAELVTHTMTHHVPQEKQHSTNARGRVTTQKNVVQAWTSNILTLKEIIKMGRAFLYATWKRGPLAPNKSRSTHQVFRYQARMKKRTNDVEWEVIRRNSHILNVWLYSNNKFRKLFVFLRCQYQVPKRFLYFTSLEINLFWAIELNVLRLGKNINRVEETTPVPK